MTIYEDTITEKPTGVDAKFLTTEEVDAVFQIIAKAIQSSRPKRSISPLEANAAKAAALLLICAGLGFALLVCLAASFHFWPSLVLANFALWVAVGTEMSSLLSLIAIVLQTFPILNRARANPVVPILDLALVDLSRLMPYCNNLIHCRLLVLAYVRMQIAQQRNAFDNRRASLIGQLDKVGAFPAIATLAVSAFRLTRDIHVALSGSIVWTAAGSIAAFYLLSLLLADTSDKFAHIVELLDFVIEHHPETKSDEKD